MSALLRPCGRSRIFLRVIDAWEQTASRVAKRGSVPGYRIGMRHMPVLRDGELAGIIKICDVVKYRLDDLELETNVLRDAYIAAR